MNMVQLIVAPKASHRSLYHWLLELNKERWDVGMSLSVCMLDVQCHVYCIKCITISTWMRLDTVDDVRVGHEHVDDLTTPLVPEEHTTTVTTTHHPVLSPEVGLLDLRGREGERGRGERGRGRGRRRRENRN